MIKIKTEFLCSKGGYYSKEVRAKRIVCYECNGEGTELRGGLKGAAFSADEVNEWDDETRENYFGGAYDVECSECKGRNVVDVVDFDALTDEEKDDRNRWEADDRQHKQEIADERRLGC